jgi:hypothetical protein
MLATELELPVILKSGQVQSRVCSNGSDPSAWPRKPCRPFLRTRHSPRLRDQTSAFPPITVGTIPRSTRWMLPVCLFQLYLVSQGGACALACREMREEASDRSYRCTGPDWLRHPHAAGLQEQAARVSTTWQHASAAWSRCTPTVTLTDGADND